MKLDKDSREYLDGKMRDSILSDCASDLLRAGALTPDSLAVTFVETLRLTGLQRLALSIN